MKQMLQLYFIYATTGIHICSGNTNLQVEEIKGVLFFY